MLSGCAKEKRKMFCGWGLWCHLWVRHAKESSRSLRAQRIQAGLIGLGRLVMERFLRSARSGPRLERRKGHLEDTGVVCHHSERTLAHSTNFFHCPFADSRRRSPQPLRRAPSSPAQAQAAGTEPQLVLHGRQVPRLLRHHHCLLARSNCRAMR
jgi:hypothetical protein